jgi:hypothetical protein
VIIIAEHMEAPGIPMALRVRSNPLGALHIGHSIAIRLWEYPELPPLRYKTVSEFLTYWKIHDCNRLNIPVPFIQYERGLGDVVRYFAECFPLFVKKYFHGCEDRRAWMNYLCAFVPWSWKEEYD